MTTPETVTARDALTGVLAMIGVDITMIPRAATDILDALTAAGYEIVYTGTGGQKNPR